MLSHRNILLAISYVIKLSLLVAIIVSIYIQDYMTLFLSALTLVLTFFPVFLERNLKIRLPIALEFLGVFFVYSTLFLGSAIDYYKKYWWLDSVLHFLGSILLGILGLIIVYSLSNGKKVNLHLVPFFISLFSLTFAVSLGVLWEIYEFAVDYFLGFNMQETGLVDTMWDLIIDFFGAFLVSVITYGYLSKMKGKFSTFMRKVLHIKIKQD
jgi:hypothetical protein